ncbi:MAG: FAD binding domain-containing protein, partial [Candidatus Hodarchaeales archaeon]
SSPAADSATPLYVLNGEVNITSHTRGSRSIPIVKFFTGVKRNCLLPDEIITSISIPRPMKGSKSSFKKMKRSSEDLAIVGVAGFHNEIRTCLAYSAIAPTPLLIDITDNIGSIGQKLDESNFKIIWGKILPNLKPIDDVRASRQYRIHMAEILTRTILKEIVE